MLCPLPATAHATAYMVWAQEQTITKVICFQGILDVRNQYDPSKYTILPKGFLINVINNLPPSKPVLLNEGQMLELQQLLGEIAILEN